MPTKDEAERAPFSLETPDIRMLNIPGDAPTIFADTCTYATTIAGVVRLQFAEAIPGAVDSTDPGLKLRYVVNLQMPLDPFTNMVRYLVKLAKEAGVDVHGE